MSQIKVLTRSRETGEPVLTSGTRVMVDGVQIKRVTELRLEADRAGLWSLHIAVSVDPNTLFEVNPDLNAAVERK